MGIDRRGHRAQESLRQNPSLNIIRDCDRLYRGVVTANGVTHKEITVRGSRLNKTFLDIDLIGMNLPKLSRVPVATTKANNHNGVCYDPEPGDEVLVSFINGNFNLPVAIGFLFPYDHADAGMEPVTNDAPRYRFQWQGTTETIAKNGRRTVHVAENDILDVTGNGTVTIGGNLTITVTGNAHITATTAHISAPTEITGNVTITGDVAVTGKILATVSVADPKGTMEEMRGVYNGHNHLLQGLASPTQQMT